MFIYSLKASTVKFFGIVGVSLLTLAALIIFIPTARVSTTQEIAAMNENISFNNVRNAKDAQKFLSQYGWTTNEATLTECEVTIPKEFDKIMSQYNELQKQQGLDLSKYGKKTVTRYTLEVTNYPNYSGTVFANVLTFRGKVIGGDICSSDSRGFLHTFSMPSEALQ
jgi:hypothetical protein